MRGGRRAGELEEGGGMKGGRQEVRNQKRQLEEERGIENEQERETEGKQEESNEKRQ